MNQSQFAPLSYVPSGWAPMPSVGFTPGAGGYVPVPAAAQRPASLITPKVFITLPSHFDEDERDEERHFAPIIPLLDGLIKVNEWHMRRQLRRAQKGLDYPFPPLYQSGVYYKEDKPGEENWKDCWAVLADGHGDCDRLVAWRVAELRVAGYKADPVIKWKQVPKEVMIGHGYPAHMVPPDGIQMVHVCVGLPGWQRYAEAYEDNPLIEDPSKRLGMGGQFTSQV